MSSEPILQNLTQPPKASKHELYKWCDYIELRCLTHVDKRFSRDALCEAISESKDIDVTSDDVMTENDISDLPEEEEVEGAGVSGLENNEDDKQAAFSAICFNQFRWRKEAFGDAWPFELDDHAKEIRFIKSLTSKHLLYLQLLLSSSLKYCPKRRQRDLTGKFERISFYIFENLMPRGAEVHAFGAAESTHYQGHLFDRLGKLANDIRGTLCLERRHFAKNDAGDGGLDLVAWHSLCDEREGLPIAFAQCGCTADGWPDKMLEASPSRLGGSLHVRHEWATYYFMPLFSIP